MIDVIGEALVDLVRRRDGTEDVHPGGSPANVALGLARLGQDVLFTTRLGDDAYGRLAAERLEASGVRLARGSVTSAPTGRAIANLDDGGAASYDFDLTWDPPPLSLRGGTHGLHAGSLGLLLEPGGTRVLALLQEAERRGVTVSYDPNPRPTVVHDAAATLTRVLEAAALADVVKLSAEDVELLWPGANLEQAARGLLRGRRTRLVVITRSSEGSLALTAGACISVAVRPTRVIDTVGAGDAFCAGLLDALDHRGLLAAGGVERLDDIDEAQLRSVVDEAALVAAITCGRSGADPPTRAELTDLG